MDEEERRDERPAARPIAKEQVGSEEIYLRAEADLREKKIAKKSTKHLVGALFFVCLFFICIPWAFGSWPDVNFVGAFFMNLSLFCAWIITTRGLSEERLDESTIRALAASKITDAPAQDGPLVVNPRTRSSAICASCGFELSANSQCSSCNS